MMLRTLITIFAPATIFYVGVNFVFYTPPEPLLEPVVYASMVRKCDAFYTWKQANPGPHFLDDVCFEHQEMKP
jgi:hypothetical protein